MVAGAAAIAKMKSSDILVIGLDTPFAADLFPTHAGCLRKDAGFVIKGETIRERY
jgi:hypothetical protein